ncbi:MAG: glutamine amidotransferase, partial [Gemmatimonadaceae bacterium]
SRGSRGSSRCAWRRARLTETSLDALSEFLFKYRPYVYEQGTVEWAGSRLTSVAVLLGLGVVLGISIVMLRRLRATPSERALLLACRGVALATLAWCLTRPVLSVASAVPARNVVAVLVDDSRSMRIGDYAGRSRAEFVRQQFGAADSGLYRALAERFAVRFYRASGRADRRAPLSDSAFGATRSDLLASALRVLDDLEGTPVAGVVLISDGADNGAQLGERDRMLEQVRSLKARGVPLFTVGVGSDRFQRDLEVASVAAPRWVLRGGNVMLEVVVMQRGFGGASVPIVVEDSGRIIARENVTLPRNGEAVTARLRVPAADAGARRLTVRVPLRPGELIDRNNERSALVSVRRRREKILYVEGEPRFEVKFLRRAVAADSNLQLVTMVRTARDKYLRLSVDDSLELASGFPRTREELFRYRGIVLGSIEASAFALDQLRMLADFVSERGGGLLALGGRLAFAEGGYSGTPLADVLPIELVGEPGEPDSSDVVALAVAPTSDGRWHAAVQLGGSDSANRVRWESLPPLTTLNTLGRAKPGATVLLAGRLAAGGGSAAGPLLAVHRFGRGRSAAFAAQDSWLWQMDAAVSAADDSHETFWRQLLRWLVTDVPDRVELSAAEDGAEPNEQVRIRGEVVDERFVRLNGARIVGELESPNGVRTALPFVWSGSRDGEYVGDALLGDPGLYTLHARAIAGRDTLAAEPLHLAAADSEREFFAAERRVPLLRQLAEETGGRYYEPAQAADVARDLAHSASGVTVIDRKELWD